MVDNYNDIVQDVLVDLSQLVNLEFSSADVDIRRLGGLLTQPTSMNTQHFQTAVGYFKSKGASTSAAENLALLVSNLSKVSGTSVGKLIRLIESADDITFTESFYININNLRHKESQWFKSHPTYNDRALYKHQLHCYCPAPSNFFIVTADNFLHSNNDALGFISWETEAKLIYNIVSNYATIGFTPYESDAYWAITLTLFTTTLYPVDVDDGIEFSIAPVGGQFNQWEYDETEYSHDILTGDLQQVVWYLTAGPWEDYTTYSHDILSGDIQQVVWYKYAGPWEDSTEYSHNILTASLINKLVTVDSPDEKLQLSCEIYPTGCSMTAV